MCNTCIWMDIRLGVTAKNICNSFYSAWVFRFTTLFFLVSLLAGWNKIVDVSPTLSTTNILAEEVQHCKVSFKSRYYGSDGSYKKKNKRPLSEMDRNVNRREKYKAMSEEKKQKLLLQRRLKYQESKTRTPPENIIVDRLTGIMDPPECSTNTSYILHPAFNTSKDHPLPCALGNERDVLHPLSMYEKGSTSAVPGELRNKDSEIVTRRESA
nr:uncharacterized protein LOC104098001 isoform X2 [Nicotiana tomentosiformis]